MKRILACQLFLLAFHIAAAAETVPCRYGCAYYPEAWPESRWETDMRLMREAGIDLVRMGEFNWSNFEPREGEFDFAAYRRVLALCEKYGIGVMMCTPTAAMPRWMHHGHPETLKVREDGGRTKNVVRQSACVTSPAYRRFSERIVRKMAEAFRDCKAIVCWQLDNELSLVGATGVCHCDGCARLFRESLKRRYGTLERLNDELNGVFWSARFTDWEEVRAPFQSRRAWTREYMRFQAAAVRDAMRAQRDILKSANPSWKITTNNPGCTGSLRFDEIYGMLDFAAVDAYITMGNVQRARWSWSMFRGLTGRQRPFMTAETGCFSSSSDKASSYDAIRAWFWDAKLHGCGDYVFFRWRESVNGEEDHPAILPWSGKPGVGYATVKRIKAEFDAVALDLAMPASHMAIVHDAATDQFMSARGTEWSDVLHSTGQRLHAAAGRYGVIPDMVQLSDGMDISTYRLVFLPCCETLTDAQREKLAAFVEAGGTLVSFPRLSCTRPGGGSYVAEPYPVGLRSLFGIEVNERRFLKRQKGGDYYTGDLSPVPLDYPGGGAFAGYGFVERIEPLGAETIAALSATCFAGSPLATRCRRGKGEAWYIAVFPDAEGAKTVVRDFFVRLGIDVSTEWPATVTAAKRGGRTVVVNCSEAAAETPVGPLGPFEVRFL